MFNVNDCVCRCWTTIISQDKIKHAGLTHCSWNDVLERCVSCNNQIPLPVTHVPSVTHAESRTEFWQTDYLPVGNLNQRLVEYLQ